jgi:protein-S-isoprenylcysteine O-methyltransferase Ste14
MERIIFDLIAAAEIITTLILVIGLISPRHRVWPPTGKHAPGKKLMTGLFYFLSLSIIVLGIFELPAAVFPSWIRLIGMVSWLAGISLSAQAMSVLGKQATFGEFGELKDRGPYRVSRNPQYLGFMIALIGWAVFISTGLTLIACAGAIIPLLIVPLLEENWLENNYGEKYKIYKTRVRRWIGIKN